MKKIFPVILFVSIALCISIYSIYKAEYNWDIIGYISSVYSFEYNDSNIVHQKTYESIKGSVSEENFRRLTGANKYREILSTCPSCLYQTLPFYKLKPLYVVLIYFLYKLNINIVLTTVLISGIFYFLSCIIIYTWLTNLFNNTWYAFIIAILFTITPYLLNSASNSTPDSLSGFIVLLALYFLVLKRNLYLFLPCMILSIFARPDNIFLFAILTGILFFNKDFSHKKTIIIFSFIIGALCVFIINVWSGNYGYSALFYHSFIERLTNPAKFTATLNLSIYLTGMKKWYHIVDKTIIFTQMVIFLITVFIKFFALKERLSDYKFLIIIAIGLSIIIHYIIFPLLDDRFFIAQYIIINLIFVKTIKEIITAQKQLKKV